MRSVYITLTRTAKPDVEYHGQSFPVIPGMTGQVDGIIGRRSVRYYLLKPINKTRERAMTAR